MYSSLVLGGMGKHSKNTRTLLYMTHTDIETHAPMCLVMSMCSGNGFGTSSSPAGGGGGGSVFLVTNSLVASFLSNLTMSAAGGQPGTGGCTSNGSPSKGSNGLVTLITSDDPECTASPSSYVTNSDMVMVTGADPGSQSCSDVFLYAMNSDGSASTDPNLLCQTLGIGC